MHFLDTVNGAEGFPCDSIGRVQLSIKEKSLDKELLMPIKTINLMLRILQYKC